MLTKPAMTLKPIAGLHTTRQQIAYNTKKCPCNILPKTRHWCFNIVPGGSSGGFIGKTR